jgi:hypothetical protein
MNQIEIDSLTDTLAKRRVPCMVVYLHPFRLVNASDSPVWNATIDQINSRTWDYVALHKMVGGIDVGLAPPYHMVVSRDGALALPLIKELVDDQTAIQFYNTCLASFFIGGLFCEAVTLDCLDLGCIIDWSYVRVTTCASGAPNRFHNMVRLQRASSFEAIALEEPRSITFQELDQAYKAGKKVLDVIPEVEGEFLLRGVGGFARRDWGVALSNLWIIVEQLTSHLWKKHVLHKAKQISDIEGRLDFLNDQRSWTISARHELLFQLNVLSSQVYSELSKARKARNKLSHSGVLPNQAAASSTLDAVKELFKICLGNICAPFISIDLSESSLSNPFEPRKKTGLQPKYWMEIFKLPGEEELEKLEANTLKNASKIVSNPSDEVPSNLTPSPP